MQTNFKGLLFSEPSEISESSSPFVLDLLRSLARSIALAIDALRGWQLNLPRALASIFRSFISLVELFRTFAVRVSVASFLNQSYAVSFLPSGGVANSNSEAGEESASATVLESVGVSVILPLNTSIETTADAPPAPAPAAPAAAEAGAYSYSFTPTPTPAVGSPAAETAMESPVVVEGSVSDPVEVSFVFVCPVHQPNCVSQSTRPTQTPEPSLTLGFITLGGLMLGSKRKTKG
ncbi:PEP-CTERM sorting domain-containing protein [Dapis sp. BLCC M126]|uniref:PEP-CTERM sorting domain-containing protein n=1 Tax=Dapis sp. BLCC M126 TaxID=3400189 RepID=UPI003CF4C072